MRALTLALLLAAPVAAQEPNDTARATAELAISFEPGSIVMRGDTTLVYVGVTHEDDYRKYDSIAAHASLALQAAILADGGGESSGAPGWFYGGVLALGAAALLIWALEDSKETVAVNQWQTQEHGQNGSDTQAGGTTTTTTTTTTRGFCFPPGLCRRHKKNAGGGDG